MPKILSGCLYFSFSKYELKSMFPLSCAHVRAQSSCETRAHRNLGAHINVPSRNDKINTCRTYEIQMNPGKMLHKGNLMHTKTLKKFEGALVEMLQHLRSYALL